MPATPDDAHDQLALIGPRGGLLPRPAPRTGPRLPAASDPVARVLLDSPLPRLDRPFDYLVPAALHDQVQFGVKVRVPFGAQRLEAWVVGRSPATAHQGDLQWLDAVVGPEPQLTPQTLQLCRAVADHYLGTTSDVVRLAVPPRHARAAAATVEMPIPVPAVAVTSALRPGPGRWVWTCPPGTDWADWYAGTLAAVAGQGGRGLAVVPDTRDVVRLAKALAGFVPETAFAALTGQGRAADRYTAFRAAMQGAVPLVIGTRSAAFAPLAAADVLLLWDDGDDSHAERRAPYPHSREVLGLRSTPHTTYIIGAYGRSTNAQRLLDIGWAEQLGHEQVRTARPQVQATDDDTGAATPGQRAARLPPHAGSAIRAGLADGPVLVCVGRKGYVPRLSCLECRRPADCAVCAGALAITSGHAIAACERCGRLAGDWRCPHCGGVRLRSLAVGSQRTAEELGRAFPGVPVVVSSGQRVISTVPAGAALVVATPGAEPVAAGGYRAVVVLDVGAALAMPGLRSGEQAMRRWFNAGGLARSGAPMVVVADPALPVVQALIRWDPGWFASRELAQRDAAGMPPARKAVSLTGDRAALDDFRDAVGDDVTVLGPVLRGDQERVLLTVAHRHAPGLLDAVRAIIVRRSAERAKPVTVRVDPPDLL